MNKGGYEIGYKSTECFWGKNPGSLIVRIEDYMEDLKGKRVLDLGCGEGKNSYYLGSKGCLVDGYEMSEEAIKNGQNLFAKNKNVNIYYEDVLKIDIEKRKYDIIICYGLFHCFNSYEEVLKIVESCLEGLVVGGYFVLCAFNSRKQDLSAHEEFAPLLLNHSKYLTLFQNQSILFESDTDLYETHPHNNIPHVHSMTRMIIQKV